MKRTFGSFAGAMTLAACAWGAEGAASVKKLEPTAVAATTWVGNWGGLDAATNRLAQTLEKAGVKTTGSVTWIFTRGIMDESDPEKYRTEIQMPLASRGKDLPAATGDVRFEKTPAIEVATIEYHGKSKDVGTQFQKLATWVYANGHAISGPAREVVTKRSGENLDAEVQFVIGGGSSGAEASPRFDTKVREDFFAGFSGDPRALERGMKTCEATLAADPKHAEAMVWHGSGLVFESGAAFQKGETKTGMDLWMRGLAEVDQAVSLRPEDVSVLIPRAATLLAVARFDPNPEASKAMLVKGLSDYEKVLSKQKATFASLGVHSRGELLVGLGLASHDLGRVDEAKTYFERIRKELPGSDYDDLAKAWLDGSKKPTLATYSCQGCHDSH
jgi:effector-binding domain-containing protein